MVIKKVRVSHRLLKSDESNKNRSTEKRPRNKSYGKLKKYLKYVEKTIDLPKMYT